MPLRTRTHWFGVVLDCPDPPALCRFYEQLLGWTVYRSEPDWAVLAPSEHHGYNLSFQREEHHVAPVWPGRSDAPTMQAHLDLEVDDLVEAEAYARSVGARTHEHQPQDTVRVMVDPAGHLFCLYLDESDTPTDHE